MLRDQSDEAAKIRYEQYLEEFEPESVELQLLRRERQLAKVSLDTGAFCRLMDEYVAFKIEQSAFFWDSSWLP